MTFTKALSVTRKTIQNEDSFTRINVPPVILINISGVNRKTACGVPAAAQISSYFVRS